MGKFIGDFMGINCGYKSFANEGVIGDRFLI